MKDIILTYVPLLLLLLLVVVVVVVEQDDDADQITKQPQPQPQPLITHAAPPWHCLHPILTKARGKSLDIPLPHIISPLSKRPMHYPCMHYIFPACDLQTFTPHKPVKTVS